MLSRLNLKLIYFIIPFLYFFKLILYPDIIDLGGDQVSYWKILANDFTCESFEYCWRELRWTMILWTKAVSFLFGKTILSYYLSSTIPIFFAFILFTIIFYRHISFIGYLFFATLWLINPLIVSHSVNIGIVSLNLFLVSFLLVFIDTIKNHNKENYFVFILSIIFFALYGVIILNLILLPFILIYLYKDFKISYFFKFVFLFILFLLIETLILFIISEQNIVFGRIHYVIFGEGSVIDICNTPGNCSNVDYAKKFLDGGIFSRWFYSVKIPSFIIILSFLFSILNLFTNQHYLNTKSNIFTKNISLLYIIVFLGISFAIKPTIPPQPLFSFSEHYYAILLPLSIFIILKFLDEFQFINIFIKYIVLIFFGILISQYSINFVLNHYFEKYFNKNYTLFSVNKYFVKKSKLINNNECIKFINKDTRNIIYILKYHGLEKQKFSRIDRKIKFDEKEDCEGNSYLSLK